MVNLKQKIKWLVIENNFIKSNFLLYFVLVILVLKIAAVGVNTPLLQNFLFADITKIDLVNLLNENRQSLGLGTLKENSKLDEIAMAKAQDMIKNGYFAHQSPAGLSPWFWFKEIGYVYKYAGENLAVGFADSKTVYDAWFNSPTHKANLLNANYTEVGTAVVNGFGGNAILVVQEFGSPLAKPAVTPAPTKPAPKPEVVIQPKPQPQILPAPKPVVVETIPAVSDVKVTPQEEPRVTPPQVLGGSDEYVAPTDTLIKDGFYVRFLNFVIYQYALILEMIAWTILILILLRILFNIFLKVEVFNKKLMIRSLVLVLILVASLIIDRNIAGLIMPHQITI